MNTQPRNIFVMAVVFGMTALAAVAVAPTGSAHYCDDSSPQGGQCGDCQGGLTEPFHYHTRFFVYSCMSIGTIEGPGAAAMDLLAGQPVDQLKA
jgi:hypothetical protein